MAKYKNRKYIPNKSIQKDAEVGGFRDIVRAAVGQGLAFGFGDEVEAFARSLASDKDYETLVKEIRQDMQTFKEEQPALAYGSEIAGGLFTGGLGVGKTLVSTGLKSGALGTAYGAGMAEGDIGERAESATTSGIMSAIAGPVAQKFLPTKTEEAKKLMREGVELTPGQAMGGPEGSAIGKGIQRLEETATSLPILGTGEALKRSKETFNIAVYNNVLDKIGYQMPKNISIDDAPKQFQKTILERLNLTVRNLKVKNTSELQKEMYDVLLDSPLSNAEKRNIANKIDKMLFEKAKRKTVTGQLTGKDVQKADSYLNRQARNYSTSADAAQREMGDVYSEIYDVFSNYLINNNPKSLVKNYQNAKSAYGDLLVISKAGTGAAGDSMFTPKQLLRGSRALDPTSAKRKTFAGEGRLQEIGRLGEDIIGREIPESGTIPRFLTSASALGGLGAIDPLAAGVSGAILGAYQSPASQRLLLEALGGSSVAALRSQPLLTTEFLNPYTD